MDNTIKLSHVSFAVLGLIAEGESYPYELMKKIEQREIRNWTNIGKSSIYGVLGKLEENQLIESRIEVSEQNRTLKKLTITEKGFQVLKDHVFEILSTGTRLGKEWNLAFSNIKCLTRAEKIQVFENCIESLKDHKQMLEKRIQIGPKVFGGKPPLHYRGLFLIAIMHTQASIEFCETVLEELKQEKEDD